MREYKGRDNALEKQSTTLEHYRKAMELMRKQLEGKDEVNRMLAEYTIAGFSMRTAGNTVSAVPPSKEGC